MAFLNSPILKARRLGALSPETERKYQIARDRPHKPDLSDFKKLHESIAKTQKSFALFDMKASENALKRINEETKKHTAKLDIMKEGFNKVKVNEKVGFEFDEQVVKDVRERIMCSMIDPSGGMSTSSISVSRRSSRCSDLDLTATSATLLPDLTEDSSTLKPQFCQDTEDLFDTDTESVLSDFEMEIINASLISHDFPEDKVPTQRKIEYLEMDVNLKSPVSHLSQKSIILSSSGMFSIDDDEGEYAIVNEVRVSPNGHDEVSDHVEEILSSSDTENDVSETYYSSPEVKESQDDGEGLGVTTESRKPVCVTCSSWDACTWLCSQEDNEDIVKDHLNMVIQEDKSRPVQIAVFKSPILARKVPTEKNAEKLEITGVDLVHSNPGLVKVDIPGNNQTFQTCVTRLEESDFYESEDGSSFEELTTAVESDKDGGQLQTYLENLNKYDNLDSVSVCESLDTKSLESLDFERMELMVCGGEKMVTFETNPAQTNRRLGVMKNMRNEKVKSIVKQASNVLHSASADFARFGLKRSGSSANLKVARSSSTTSFNRRSYIPAPNYNLTSTLFPGKKEKLNLDTRLKLRNKELIEVEPLLRWAKKPIFATTTAGHKAWYVRAQDMIERRRKEIANMDTLQEDSGHQDLDIIVSSP